MNSKYDILTPSGWQPFHGVRRSTSRNILHISTDNGELTCTRDHLVKTSSGFVNAAGLCIGDVLLHLEGTTTILSIKEISQDVYVYDALHVGDEHEYYTNGFISHNCQFIGSSGTLIGGEHLKRMFGKNPIASSDNIKQYEQPIEGHQYAMMVDVGRGKGLDYSTFSIFDITKMPYRQVCTFRDNMVAPADLAGYVFRMGKVYNEAHVLVEINDAGGQVVDCLFMDYGYENVLYTESGGKNGKRISGGFGKNVERGIRTTKSVKAIGCSILKLLIEQQQLVIQDEETVEEFKRFSKKHNSYEAESGAHDDMVMNCVLFAWLTDQSFFKYLTEINTISNLRDKTEHQLEAEMLPFGFVVQDGDISTSAPHDLAREDWSLML
jgi:hypothetical protein